ncbi:DUF1636 domain-containing protein [Ruegeria sp. 2012CJ41-6]|uniref:DUF1636 domain-containing protein n=1 Tax=Ruegeria spongiae TaxID=2942209 RepID=A0ABT0PWQ4_9RHOB|nr:DUF1636 domain-containing protein [Ruegeria spongiae]MCL6282040.1 DUF1636 domain-containing protein [Ruegeria spongiae]
MPQKADHFLLICTTCTAGRSAISLREALTNRLPEGFAIRSVDCMAGCDHPGTVGFQAPNKAQYLFGDIRTAQDVEALAEFADQYFQSPDGWTRATERPHLLLTKTLSRMPRITQEVPT